MIGLLLSLTHLKGHPGTVKMIANMRGYYFPRMYTVTRSFVTSCYGCFLTNNTTRSQKLGIYPVPSSPFEEVMMDLIENLPGCERFSHLLLAKCVLTDYTIIVPLKSKTASEVTHGIIQNILIPHNVSKLVSDNGPAFRNKQWLEAVAAFGITVVPTSALHPEGRGEIERLVQTVKIMLRKMLATRPNLRWDWLPYLVAKILNNTVSPKTGLIPQQMVGGADGGGAKFLESDDIAPIHNFVRNSQGQIERLTREIQDMAKEAKDRVTLLRMTTNEKLNKTRIKTNFQPGDYVFVLDRQIVEGNSRVLKTKFSPSPWIVIKPLWTTTLIRRLADGFVTLYANGDIKLFSGIDPIFKGVPVEIQRVLINRFSTLTEADLATISKHATIDIPNSIPLTTHDESPQPIHEDQEGGTDQAAGGPMGQPPEEVEIQRVRPPTRGQPDPNDGEEQAETSAPPVVSDPEDADLRPPNNPILDEDRDFDVQNEIEVQDPDDPSVEENQNPIQTQSQGKAKVIIADESELIQDINRFKINEDIRYLRRRRVPENLRDPVELEMEDPEPQEAEQQPEVDLADPNQPRTLRSGKRVTFTE
jgi:hypothetical protein